MNPWAAGARGGFSFLGAYNKYLAGETAAGEYETQARQIELQATQREADRKAQLNKALSSMMARGGASGVVMEGSPLSVMESAINESAISGERDGYASQLEAMTARARKKAAKRGKTGALLDFATDMAGIAGDM